MTMEDLERTPLLGGNHPNSHVTKNEAASHCGSDCHQPPDLMAPPENEAEGVTTHIYPKRFWILIVYSLLAWFQCAQWNTWGPISESVDVAFSGWGSQTVAMMGNWGTIMFVVGVVPMCWLLEAKGLRVGVLACAGLLAVGTVMRIIPFATDSDAFFTVMSHLCAICVGLAATIAMAAPPTIAAVWFPPKERTTATAFSQVLNQLGNVGSYMEPLLVRSPGKGATPEDIRSDIKRLLYIDAAIAVTLLVVILVYFPTKPPLPPSVTSSVDRYDFITSMKKVFRNRDVLLVTLSFGIAVGIPLTWLSVLNFSLRELGIDQDDAMWIGILAVVFSGISGLLAGRMTDLVYGHVKLSLILLMSATLACFYWFFLLSWGAVESSRWQVYFTVVGGLSFNFATAPLFMELAVEAAYPCPEIVVGGMLMGLDNFVGLVFLLLFFIPNIGYEWVTYSLLATGAFAILPLMLMRENYARSNIDRADANEALPDIVIRGEAKDE
ncbi:solute carrier family 49 member 4 homolog [Penaeus japonicus]|uniref:solute carrier family 49 member 4 homolog n=1 Tax=Penaeus japonicus TaxID=27405 RepID=UPI001C713371|nr:solute carrier family 49 member 4 homolog [Penaeus japonicus]XP_042864098.1 solute carrier family 49 member 4 homolog [Penaeus japonicus]XP_042864099.1 solute carrier family 49 member 4 homolog [Penaeus japonicus]